ncbi:MAG: RNA-guided pseudouridylation complex pseudouridine synthase subunit Cbf5 [DPANN group archaeon]|nr:RNA-guided pseudouridylation complex pseudouridine synthase subunit Cbf5 [DPANN group archaeon]
MNKLRVELVKRKLIFKQKATIKKLKAKTAAELLNSGLIIIDKPCGPKSIHVGNRIRTILEQPKVGHAGTLDPMVTGVLPIGIGKGVKVLSLMSKAGKVYEGRMHIHNTVTKEQVLDAFAKFTGKIEQLPPRISAVARKLRTREIYWLTLKKFKGKDVEFEVGCEAGTYIRKLCHDMGEYLKTGGHMAELRRLQAGPFKIKSAVTLEKVKENYDKYLKTKKDAYVRKIILPLERGAEHLPKVYVDLGVAERITHGSPVFTPGVLAYTSDLHKDKEVAVFDTNSNLLAIGIAQLDAEEMENAQKGMAVKTDVVLI